MEVGSVKEPATWSLRCVDAGSEYCPCHLAESGTCLVCSLLAGADFCDCLWSGSCSYLNHLFAQGGLTNRSEVSVVTAKKHLTPELLELRFRIERNRLPSFSHAGTFLFVRPASALNHAAVPISIVDVTIDEVWLVIDCVGPKTHLLKQAGPQMIIRGPYYTALSNSQILKTTRNTNTVLVAGGVGQSAIVLAAKALLRGGNRVWACLAPGTTGLVYVEQSLKNYGVEVQTVPSMRQQGMQVIRNWLALLEPTIIVCAGPDKLQDMVWAMVQSVSSKAEFVCSQNVVMCCGDGLCGSCLSTRFGEKRVPLCKAQYSIRGGS